MQRILIIGCGDVALRTAKLLRGNYRLFGLVRHAARVDTLRAAGIVPLLGDLDERNSLRCIAGLADFVLHLAPPAGSKLPADGLPRAVLSATEGITPGDVRTRHLLAALSSGALPRRIIYISTSGVYGDCGGAVVSETHPLHPQTERARRRVDAERQIRAWSARNGVCASVLRVPGIYSSDRLPLDRLRTHLPSITSAEDSYTNLIHADDLARIIIAAMQHGRSNRTYHASDDSSLKMGAYFDAVADALGLPRPPRLPRAEVTHAVSQALWSFLNESRRLTNARLKRELKVKLHYPTLRDGLAAISRGNGASS